MPHQPVTSMVKRAEHGFAGACSGVMAKPPRDRRTLPSRQRTYGIKLL